MCTDDSTLWERCLLFFFPTHHETRYTALVHTSLLSSPKQPLILPPHVILAILSILGPFHDLGVFCGPYGLGWPHPLAMPLIPIPACITQPPCSSPGLTFFSRAAPQLWGFLTPFPSLHLVYSTARPSSLPRHCRSLAFLRLWSTLASLLSLPFTA